MYIYIKDIKLDKIIGISLLYSQQDTRGVGNEMNSLFWKSSLLFHPALSYCAFRTYPWLLVLIFVFQPTNLSLIAWIGLVNLKWNIQRGTGAGSGEVVFLSSPHYFWSLGLNLAVQIVRRVVLKS